jgi:nitrogen fixation NifU-like protein
VNDLRELYQEVILDHSKHPRHFREMPEANHHADGHNPLCGDRVTVYLNLAGDVVEDVSFQGAGCSISTASASMMADALRGKKVDEVKALFDRFHELVTSDPSHAAENVAAASELGKLAVFSGVCEFPMRVKCASLPWHTMKAALEGAAKASTE